MARFYTREETETEITIIYRYYRELWIVVSCCFVGAFAAAVISQEAWIFFVGLSSAFLINLAYMKDVAPVEAEETKARQASGVYIAGRQSPFSNTPRTVIIPKGRNWVITAGQTRDKAR